VYSDRWISCDNDGIRVRGYYFPWGAKRIAYASVRSVARVPIGLASGRARIWGTANPRFWLNFDPARPRKDTGFIVDLGRWVRPILTPDDPHAFETEISSRVRVDSGAGFV
jgi:hypothetical protein